MSAQTTANPVTPTVRAQRGWGKDAFRIGFGVLWLVDAGFKWQPGFHRQYMDLLMSQGEGDPTWLHWWFAFWKDLEHPHPHFFAYLAAVCETLIGFALILGFARKLTYIAGALFSLLIWATAEGFGGPYTADSTDIGAAVIYAFVFAGLLALNYAAGPSRYSIDYLIEQRVSWWYRIAEVGRQRAEPPAVPHAPAGPAAPPTPGGSKANHTP